jgi:hypothetical protein
MLAATGSVTVGRRNVWNLMSRGGTPQSTRVKPLTAVEASNETALE